MTSDNTVMDPGGPNCATAGARALRFSGLVNTRDVRRNVRETIWRKTDEV